MTTYAHNTAIVGLGATEFSKNSGRSELKLGVEAALAACADAGINPHEVDGFCSYVMDKVPEYELARMMGGSPDSEAGVRHAAELLAGSRRAQ